MGKLPAFMFYPGDWLKDPALRAVSVEARGLWIDMLCLMHNCDRRGYLQVNGKPVSNDQLARMTGCSTEQVSRLLQELFDSGVCSAHEHGCFSRRMVRDEAKRLKCSEAGKRGGNPTLKGQSKGGSKGLSKGDANPLPTPSYSDSVSYSEERQSPSSPLPGDVPPDAALPSEEEEGTQGLVRRLLESVLGVAGVPLARDYPNADPDYVRWMVGQCAAGNINKPYFYIRKGLNTVYPQYETWRLSQVKVPAIDEEREKRLAELRAKRAAKERAKSA